MARHDLAGFGQIWLTGSIDHLRHLLEITTPNRSWCDHDQSAGDALMQVLMVVDAAARDEDDVTGSQLLGRTINRNGRRPSIPYRISSASR
jgi:hypothetical protein